MAAYLSIEALADPSRRTIFERLAGGDSSVVELTRDMPISRPAVSQHLKVLKDAGLVSVRASGTRRIYSVDPVGISELRDYFDQFWTGALQAYRRAVEDDHALEEKP